MVASELIKLIEHTTNLPPEIIKSTLKEIYEVIASELNAQREVEISGFGTFVMVNYPSRTIINPHDKTKKIVTLSSPVVKFRPEKSLVKAVRTTCGNRALAADFWDELKQIPQEILNLFPEHLARHYWAMPVKIENGIILVAMVEPDNDDAINILKRYLTLDFKPIYCPRENLHSLLAKNFSRPRVKIEFSESSEAEVQKAFTKTVAIRIINSVLRKAANQNINHFDFEINENNVLVRFIGEEGPSEPIILPKSIFLTLLEN